MLKFYAAYYPCHAFNGIFQEVRTVYEADFILFQGGVDICEKFFREDSHETMTNRDEEEYNLFQFAQKNGLFSVGICRGLQLLGALSGVKLIQDISHPGQHSVTITTDWKERHIGVNSIHHQMVYPVENYDDTKISDKIQIMATSNLSRHHSLYRRPSLTAHMRTHGIPEVEAAFFPQTRSFGVQWHPEMFGRWDGDKAIDIPAVSFFVDSIERLIRI